MASPSKAKVVLTVPSNNHQFTLPEEWKDPKRAAFLSSDFRPREVNPDGYDNKVAFWVRNILRYSSQERCVFTTRAFREVFVRDGSLPTSSCISTVIATLLQSDKVKLRSQLQSELITRMNKSWLSTGYNLISWTVSTLIGSSSSPKVSEEDELVNVEAFDEECKTLASAYPNGKIVRYEEVVARFPLYSSELFDLILLNLQAQGLLSIASTSSGKILKFGKNALLSDVEVGQFELEFTRRLLEEELTNLHEQVDQLKSEAKSALSANNRNLASQILRRKKRLEMHMEKKQQQLGNIDALAIQIEQSDSQTSVLQSYRTAANILKSVSADRTDVDQTVSELDELVDNNIEIQNELANVWASHPDIALDEDALEAELQQILESNEKKHTSTLNSTQEAELYERLAKLRIPSGDLLSEAKSSPSVKEKKVAQAQ